MLRELTRDCVHCGFCLPTCPTYALDREEMDSPRGRIQLMEASLDGTVQLSRTVIGHFDSCLGCMACLSSCPSGVRYDRLIEETRHVVETTGPRTRAERRQRALLFATLPYPARMRLALRLAPLGRALPSPAWAKPMLDLAPAWRSTTQAPSATEPLGTGRGRVGILTGCVQRVLFGDVNAATARVLAAEGLAVTAPPQGCCGALSVHAGRLDEGRRFARATVAAFEGIETVVVNASGCGSHLKELGWLLRDDPTYAERAEAFSARVRDVHELLSSLAPQAEYHPLPVAVAVQDSCHLRHAQRLPLASRDPLQRIPGIDLREPAEQDICCGSAGIYNVTQPATARALGDRKAAHVRATGAVAYASANPGCLVQVAQALGRAGSPLPAFHPIELLDASIRRLDADVLLRNARR
jgi:glycolate oxidase iron-sulfur subunit